MSATFLALGAARAVRAWVGAGVASVPPLNNERPSRSSTPSLARRLGALGAGCCCQNEVASRDNGCQFMVDAYLSTDEPLDRGRVQNWAGVDLGGEPPRSTRPGFLPRLADLIRQKAEEAAARRAPAVPPPDPDGGAGGLNAGSGLRCLVSALRMRETTRRIPCLVFLRSYQVIRPETRSIARSGRRCSPTGRSGSRHCSRTPGRRAPCRYTR